MLNIMRIAGMRITMKNNYKCKICLGSIVMIFVIILWQKWSPCVRLYMNDRNGIERPHFACMPLQGRLANQMFQYAFMYAFSRDKELAIMMSEARESNILSSTFEIDFGLNNDYGLISNGDCSCFWKYEDEWDCAYDKKFEEMEKRQDVHLLGYFQSWKYWKHYEEQIRNTFHFQEHVRISAQAVLQNIIRKSGINPAHGDILVGIHIRRGDYVKEAVFTEYGYTTATEQYLHKATQLFRNRYKNPTFIVCSNDFTWARTALGTFNDVYFAEGNTPETDMALLSSTNHTIMTVGTFGWWSAFLTNGTTLYYKHPFVKGSPFSKQFHGNTAEHFYPGWIGLE